MSESPAESLWRAVVIGRYGAPGLAAAETEPEQEPEDGQEGEQDHPVLLTLVGLAACAAIAFGLVMLVIAIDPGRVDVGKEPSVFELLIANRTTLIALRVGLLCIVVYLAWSMAILIKDRRPIDAIAGISVTKVAREAQNAGEAAVEQVRVLQQELAEANENIDYLIDYIGQLRNEASNGDDAADHEDEPDVAG